MGPIAMEGGARIGVNAHLLSGQESFRRAGIHHYISQILNHLPQDERSMRFTIFVNHAGDLRLRHGDSIESSRFPTERPLARIMWEQMVWPLTATRKKIDLLHSMAFVTPLVSRIPAVVTVYDLSFVYYPERIPALRRAYLASQCRRSCLSARRVVTISESGRQDVHELYGVPLERIDVVHPGVDRKFRTLTSSQIEEFRRRQALPRQFVLHVGTLQPRKNLLVLIDAFARLKRPELGLVLVGGKGWNFNEIFDRVIDLNLQNRVRFTGYVSDDDLPLWYNSAAVLVFPSLYEGFGMPVVQALACGTPVIAANTSAVPEAAGDAGLLFEPQNVGMLADHMVSVLDDSQRVDTMRQRGILHAQHFSWKRSAQKMIRVYQQALRES